MTCSSWLWDTFNALRKKRSAARASRFWHAHAWSLGYSPFRSTARYRYFRADFNMCFIQPSKRIIDYGLKYASLCQFWSMATRTIDEPSYDLPDNPPAQHHLFQVAVAQRDAGTTAHLDVGLMTPLERVGFMEQLPVERSTITTSTKPPPVFATQPFCVSPPFQWSLFRLGFCWNPHWRQCQHATVSGCALFPASLPARVNFARNERIRVTTRVVEETPSSNQRLALTLMGVGWTLIAPDWFTDSALSKNRTYTID